MPPKRFGGRRPLPLAVRRHLLRQYMSECKRKATGGDHDSDNDKDKDSDINYEAFQNNLEGALRTSLECKSKATGSDSESDSDSDSDSSCYSSCDSDIDYEAFRDNPEGLRATLVRKLKYHGLMLLLFETPSGFALFTSFGGYCYLPDSVNDIWAMFDTYIRSLRVVSLEGFQSFEDKSRVINADTGVDKQLVDLINKWHKPGMKLCVGKPEYKEIIESKLKIPCMCCQAVMEIMWGIQHQMRKLVPQETSELTKEDRLPMSQGLKNFLSRNGFDVKPEMVNEKIVAAAHALFKCDAAASARNDLFFLRNAGLYIRDISGISCESWDILKLAIAVKVICCPDEELTDFHEVLAEDKLSKLKADALKYKGITDRPSWLRASKATVATYHLRIAKKKLLGSLVKEAYEAEAAEVCEEDKMQVESKQIPEEHAILDNRYSSGLSPRPSKRQKIAAPLAKGPSKLGSR